MYFNINIIININKLNYIKIKYYYYINLKEDILKYLYFQL